MLTFSRLGHMGRLCNGMFSIAGTIGIAMKSGQDYAFPLWRNYDGERFEPGIDIDLYKHFVNPLPVLHNSTGFQEYPYFWGYRQLALPYGNWDLQSHFQSEKYFKEYIDLIRHYFTMYGEEKLSSTAVHMRFGDYDETYHPRPKVEYYTEALKYIPVDSELLLFSDDNILAEQLMRLCTVRSWKVVNHDYIHSFVCMKSCKHFICANSSYSLMAAILAPNPDKIIVCPKNWFGPAWGSNANEEMTKDIYPEGAVVI